MEFARICDLVEPNAAAAEPIDVSALPGRWVNSNHDTTGVAHLVISGAGDRLSIETYAVGADGLIEWGAADAVIFTSTPLSRIAAGFTCRYDFGFAETRLLGMMMKGLLVLAQLHSFKDESGRIDYFAREYFAQLHE